MQRISKHLSLACEGGAVYRLLLQGVSQQELEIQQDLLTAAYGAEVRLSRLHPAAHLGSCKLCSVTKQSWERWMHLPHCICGWKRLFFTYPFVIRRSVLEHDKMIAYDH